MPGDKSISHRWLLMAATANGSSRLEGLPRSLDTSSTATCLAMLAPAARPALEAWASSPSVTGERHGSTWNRDASTLDLDTLDLQGEGREIAPPADPRARLRELGDDDAAPRRPGLVISVRNGAPRGRQPVDEADGARREAASRDGRGRHHAGRPSAAHDPRCGAPRDPIRARGPERAGEERRPPRRPRGARERRPSPSASRPGITRSGLFVALGAPIRSDGGRPRARGAVPARGIPRGGPGRSVLRRVPARSGRAHAAGTSRSSGVEPEPDATRASWTCLGGWVSKWRSTSRDHELGEPVGRMHLAPGRRAPTRPRRRQRDAPRDRRGAAPRRARRPRHGPSRFEGGAELRVKESDRLSVLGRGDPLARGRSVGGGRRPRGRRGRAGGRVRPIGRRPSDGDGVRRDGAGRPGTFRHRRDRVGRGLVPGLLPAPARARGRRRGVAVTPRVVAIDGAAGSGKSTLARLLATTLGLPVRQHGCDVSRAHAGGTSTGRSTSRMRMRWFV